MAASTASSHDGARPKVVLTRASLPSALLQDAHHAGRIELIAYDDAHNDGKGAPRDWLLTHARAAHALLVFLTDAVDEELIDAAGPSLRCVSTMSVGVDHIDVPLLRARQIRIGYTPKVLDEAVAELSLGLALMSTRNVSRALGVVSRGEWGQHPWTPLAFCGPSLRGKTIGFYGFGAIAQSIVLLLPPWHPAKIVYTTSRPQPFEPSLTSDPTKWATLRDGGWIETVEARRRRPGVNEIEVCNVTDLLEMVAQVDVLFVIASLNPSTKHAINAGVLSKMKPTAHLINTSRGPLVDTDALVDALRRGMIAGAALDVLEGEPNIPASHPLLGADIRDKVVVLPHIGSATTEARRAMADWSAQNVLGALGVEKGKEEAGGRWRMAAEY